MQPDIIKIVELDFENPKEVVNILEAMKFMNRRPVSDRVYRAIIFLSKGSMSRLNHFTELALTDYRDLLWQAEYENPEVQKYDFNKSFSELGIV